MDFDFDHWRDPTDVCGACGFGGQVGCTPGCPELLRVEHDWAQYQLQLAAEQAAQQAAAEEAAARATFWRLWQSGDERVKRLKRHHKRDHTVQWC